MFSNKKGQYLSFDVIVASVIFLMTLVMLMSYWQSMKSTVMNENKYLLSSANLVADNLLTDYSSIGILKEGKQVVNVEKFKLINETDLKEFSGGDNVFIQITGDDIQTSVGNRPNGNDNDNVARVTRIVSLGNDMGTLNVIIYRNANK